MTGVVKKRLLESQFQYEVVFQPRLLKNEIGRFAKQFILVVTPSQVTTTISLQNKNT
jgi:hypothetical protein